MSGPPDTMTSPGPQEPASLGEAVRAVSDDVRRLARAEVALAKAEMAAGARARGVAIGLSAAAGLLALYALFWLTFAIYAAWLGLVPAWAAALLTVVVLAAVATPMVLVAVHMFRTRRGTPQRALAAAKTTVDLLRERAGP